MPVSLEEGELLPVAVWCHKVREDADDRAAAEGLPEPLEGAGEVGPAAAAGVSERGADDGPGVPAVLARGQEALDVIIGHGSEESARCERSADFQ